MTSVTITHKGWFGLCPVYMGDLGSDAPFVAARSPWLEPLFDLSKGIFRIAHLWFAPTWPLFVTGELTHPRRVELSELSEF